MWHLYMLVIASIAALFSSVLRPVASVPPAVSTSTAASVVQAVSVTALPATSASSTASVAVPILVYHIIRPSYASDDAAVRAIALTPEVFDAELTHLHDAGYHVVSFHDLEAYFANGTPLPSKPIILSFDDAWRNQFVYAFPLLKQHGDTATFFVFTNAIGNKGFLTWDDLHALIAAGMTIGDHSRSHPFLTRIKDTEKLKDEISGSKQVLEKGLGSSVTEFAYPFGQYNSAIIALVKQAGFESARGDYWSGSRQTAAREYTLSALNAPTTTAEFDRMFP